MKFNIFVLTLFAFLLQNFDCINGEDCSGATPPSTCLLLPCELWEFIWSLFKRSLFRSIFYFFSNLKQQGGHGDPVQSNYYDPTIQGCCKDRVYSLEKSICCHGSLQSTNGNRTNCCDKTSYNPSQFVCCSGILTSFKVNAQLACCDKKPYYTSYQMCCNGIVNPVLSSSFASLSCCGTASYDPDEQTCCRDHEGSVVVGSSIQSAAGGEISCCRSAWYDTNQQGREKSIFKI